MSFNIKFDKNSLEEIREGDYNASHAEKEWERSDER